MQSKPLKVFKNVNWDFTENGLKRNAKILMNYLSWLWMIAKLSPDSKESITIFRGINYKADRKYALNRNYRFDNFFNYNWF